MVAATSTPDKITVARRLDAAPEQLEQFVTNHPDPSAGVVLRSSVTSKPPHRVADETRQQLAEWIAHRKDRQHDGPRWWVVAYLRHNGATPPERVAVEVADQHSVTVQRIHRAIFRLRDGDCVRPVPATDDRPARLVLDEGSDDGK
jgi:hypothetical protein